MNLTTYFLIPSSRFLELPLFIYESRNKGVRFIYREATSEPDPFLSLFSFSEPCFSGVLNYVATPPLATHKATHRSTGKGQLLAKFFNQCFLSSLGSIAQDISTERRPQLESA